MVPASEPECVEDQLLADNCGAQVRIAYQLRLQNIVGASNILEFIGGASTRVS